jgi:glyoxylase-like metal-dependent hydrolase (beta-lactamase superfamily II)
MAATVGSDDSPTPSPVPADTGDIETGALEWAQVSLGNVSAYVLVRGNQAAVVDTGNPGSTDQIASTLQALGVGWSDVQHVILTHSHNDHVGSVGDAVGRAPGAKLYAGAADIAAISAPLAIEAVGEGDDVFGLEVIETPGHTPGSISVIDHDAGLLIAGDALNGNAAGTDILGASPRFSSDMAAANESIRKLAGLSFDTAAFGHGNPFTGAADRAVASLADTL